MAYVGVKPYSDTWGAGSLTFGRTHFLAGAAPVDQHHGGVVPGRVVLSLQHLSDDAPKDLLRLDQVRRWLPHELSESFDAELLGTRHVRFDDTVGVEEHAVARLEVGRG